MNHYPPGSVVRARARFYDADPESETYEAQIDPTTVTVTFRQNGADDVTYVYGTDAELTRATETNDAGEDVPYYEAEYETDAEGFVAHYWTSTGTGQTRGKGSFRVKAE